MLHMLGPSRHWTPKHYGAHRRTLTLPRFHRLHVRSGLRISRYLMLDAPAIGAGPISTRLLQFLAEGLRRVSSSYYLLLVELRLLSASGATFVCGRLGQKGEHRVLPPP